MVWKGSGYGVEEDRTDLLSLPADVLRSCCTYCAGRDLLNLVAVNRSLCVFLTSGEQDEFIWKVLYQKHCKRFAKRIRKPIFPNAQNWRQAYLRSVGRKVSGLIACIGYSKVCD